MFIDSHTHLDSKQFDEDRAEVIERARAAGISKLINVGFDRQTISTTIQLAEQYDFIYALVGWHPVESIHMLPGDLDWIASLCDHPKVVGIGEIGLDYHWDTSPKDVQQRVFREQIQLARQKKMPISIHNRDAHEDVLRILKEEGAKDVGGVMHCFSGSWETARQCLDMNFYISFGGPLTFKNARVPKEVLAQVPLDRILIETDAPYLAPHPYRGKRNESAFVRLVAETVAEIRGKTIEEISKITTENTLNCFSFKEKGL